MAGRTRILAAGKGQQLGRDESVLTIGEEPGASAGWVGRRLLSVNGAPAFELSCWCGTCPYLFERLAGANSTLSIDDVQSTMAQGLSEIDENVVAAFAALLPAGEYIPLLLEIEPVLTYPMKPGDYFAEELERTWRSSDGFWGLPEYPRTPYYRGETRELDDETLFSSSSFRWSRRAGTTARASTSSRPNWGAQAVPRASRSACSIFASVLSSVRRRKASFIGASLTFSSTVTTRSKRQPPADPGSRSSACCRSSTASPIHPRSHERSMYSRAAGEQSGIRRR